MMMFGDTKKTLTSILSRRKEDGSSEAVEAKNEKSFDPKMEAHRSIAEELHHAIETKSIDGIAKALKSHTDLINAGAGKEEESEGVE